MSVKDLFTEAGDPIFCDDEGNYLFTCPKCGGHDLVVKEVAILTVTEVYEQVCRCSGPLRGSAGYTTITTITPSVNCYLLDGEHRFRDNPIEHPLCDNEDFEEEEEREEEIICSACFDPDKPGKLIERKEAEEVEYWVFCEECGKEVEFGWSHPDRGGRIWPAEAKDFNPWICWPEPRYRKSWLKKGWIKPAFLTEKDKEFLKSLPDIPEVYKEHLD